MKRLVMCALMIASCVAFAACGDVSELVEDVASGSVSEDTSDDQFNDVVTLQDEDGNEFTVNQTKEVGLAGTYVCAADHSVWSFGGDTLGVAYYDLNDSLSCYVCKLAFYETEADADGKVSLYLVVYNLSSEDLTYWNVSNLVDTEDNNIGIFLSLPGDNSQYIQLVEKSYYESGDTATGDAR